VKLNIGCGANHLDGYVNIDADPELKPDLVLDIGKDKLPFSENSIDEIVTSHTIEHIPRQLHFHVFNEINRVLKVGGDLFVSFPDFARVSDHYLNNKRGQKKTWETVIFGRRLNNWDCHVCAMVTSDFVNFLKECGFSEIRTAWEENTDFNSLVLAKKAFTLIDKSDILRKEVVERASIRSNAP
jgi:hypothetical protein